MREESKKRDGEKVQKNLIKIEKLAKYTYLSIITWNLIG